MDNSTREEASEIKRPNAGRLSSLLGNRPLNLITGPIIYSMIIPLLIFDIFISFYHSTCFSVYRIKKVSRKDYIVFDRHALQYLNIVEKFHCTYCAYAVGLIAYGGEIVARTEAYFCPIKHEQKIAGSHSRYAHFIEYGDSNEIESRVEAFRSALEVTDNEKNR